MSKPICKECGGTIHGAYCLLCEMFEARSSGASHGKGWPMVSDALAVHPDQIPEAMERNRQHGVYGVSYDPSDGTAIIESRGAQKSLIRAEQQHDPKIQDRNGWMS